MTKKEALLWAENLRDGNGRALDPEMVRPVAAFRYLQIPTLGSCWGHRDRGLSYPWIDFPSDLPAGIPEEFPAMHLLAKGRRGARRLTPLEILDVTSRVRGSWDAARQDLLDFANRVL